MTTYSQRLKNKIIELTGEDPIDLFGETDWELYAEEYIEEEHQSSFSNKFGGA